MDSVTAATLKVIIDAQAWLYAELLLTKAELRGATTTQEQFEEYEHQWKKETAALIETLLEEPNEV